MRSTRFQVPICTRVPVTHSINTRLRLLPRYFLSLLFANYTHTADQNVTLPASTQHSTAQHSTAQHSTAQHKPISSAQLALGGIKLLVAPDHGPLLSAFFTFRCILPCASLAGGVSRTRSGPLVQPGLGT